MDNGVQIDAAQPSILPGSTVAPGAPIADPVCPCGAGKLFTECHGVAPAPYVPPTLAPSSQLVRLDLGCGNTPQAGFDGVDIYGDKAKHRVDLFKFPWPWAGDSVDEIHCSHFMEHIPAREVEERDITGGLLAGLLGKDMLFAFMDECYRILKKDSWMTVIVPCLRNNRAFQDPTHRRFICEDTFAYFWAEWRKLNIPQYPVKCNFETQISTTIPPDVGLKHADVQAQLIRNSWNVGFDIHAKMKCIKP